MSGQLRADELAWAAMRKSGARGPSELAAQLRLPGYHSPKRVQRWLNGENTPRYEETIELLRLAGLLNERRLAAAQESAEEGLRRAEQLRARRTRRPRGETESG